MYVFSHLLINSVLAFVGESNVLIAIVLVFVFIHSVLAFVGLLEYNLLIAIVLLFGRCLDDYFERWRPLARALALAQMWKVLDFYTLHLFQCAFFFKFAH